MNLTEIQILRKILENRGLLLKIATTLGLDIESLGYSRDIISRWEIQRKIPKKYQYLKRLQNLQAVCQRLVDQINNQSLGYEIYKTIEDNEEVFFLRYERTPLFETWQHLQLIYKFLKNKGFEYGLSPIPKYIDNKQKLNKKLDSVMKSLEFIINWVEDKISPLKEEAERTERKLEEYHKFIKKD